jgi:3-oxoacyl-[acyl-carrier protein] reductase
VRGTWLSCRAVAPYLKRQRSGRIVTFGSTAAVAGVAGYLPYVTAKAALVGLTRALARELGEFGVAVNMVCPSIDALDGSDPVNAEAALGTGATPDQVADAVVFLAGDGTDFVTGQSWVVDGGLVLQ